MADGVEAALAFVLVGVLLLTAAAIATAGSDTYGDPTDITSETFTPNAGTFVALNHSNSENLTYDRRVEVRDENDSLAIEGEDYEWEPDNGTIQAVAGGELDGDSEASINYTIYDPTDEQDQVLVLVDDLLASGAWLPIILFVGLLLAGLALLGGLT